MRNIHNNVQHHVTEIPDKSDNTGAWNNGSISYSERRRTGSRHLEHSENWDHGPPTHQEQRVATFDVRRSEGLGIVRR